MASPWNKTKRLLTWDWWRPDVPQRTRQTRLLLVLLALVVAGLGIADYASGPILDLTLFYLIPPAVGTIVAGRRAGLALATESAISATVADFAGAGNDRVVFVVNGVLLLAILALIVFLIAAARDTALAASDAAQRRKEFLAYAAHQLRTPLAGIRASTDALLVGGATSSQERLLVNLSREADRAGRLLSSLLQMARVDQGEVGTLQALDVVELCQSELDRKRSDGHAVTTSLVVPANRPGPVLMSGEATRNALANLLDNARRHARTQVTVEIRTSVSAVDIAVRDDGPGLPEGTAERVFERFVSLDGEGGSGLGLPIARGLIEAQGGRLTYEDHRFVIHLPYRRPTPAQAPTPTPVQTT
jgi:signal transduction histidine kinase